MNDGTSRAVLHPQARQAYEAEFLAGFQQRLECTLMEHRPEESGLLGEAARHLCLAPGAKHARARLCMKMGQMLGTPCDALTDVAVCVELMHAASLLHDDVVDDGEVRRGRVTVNRKWGNAVAVLAGDAVLSLALRLLTPHPAGVTVATIDVITRMSQGALLELEMRGNPRVSADAWRHMAAGKTAALFGLCGSASGILAGSATCAELLRRVGEHLGMAFQMADDLQDLVDEAEGIHSDLTERNASFPVALAVASSSTLMEGLQALWSQPVQQPGQARTLAQQVLQSAAVDTTREAILHEVHQASAALKEVHTGPAAQEVLEWAASLGADPRTRTKG